MLMRVADLKRSHSWRAIRMFLLVSTLGGCGISDEGPPPPVTVTAQADEIVPVVAMEEPVVPPIVPTPRPKELRPVRQRPETRISQPLIAVINPDRLIGLEPSAVQKLLGTPVRVEKDDISREWVYAASGCSFRVFFYPNLNAKSFRALKYGSNNSNGELMDISDVCIRHILRAKNNAPN